MRVNVLVTEGFTASSLSITLDVFRACNRLASKGLFEVEVLSPQGGTVRSAAGLVVEGTRSVKEYEPAEVTLLPGIWAESGVVVGEMLSRPAGRALVDHLSDIKGTLGASCSGTLFMAETGLLDGRRATTTWILADYFRRRFPRVRLDADAALVEEDRFITAGAAFAQTDLVLRLVGRLAGAELACSCANVLLLDRRPSQARYMALHQLAGDQPLLRSADRWVRAHLDQEFSIQELASELSTSPRTLARRMKSSLGMSPVAFVQRLRVESALRLLETTQLSLEEIADRVGYRGSSTLSRLIRRHTNCSPGEIRRRRLG